MGKEVVVWPRGDKTSIMGRFTQLSVKVGEKVCSTNDCLTASCIQNYHSQARGVLYDCGGEVGSSVEVSNESNQLLMVAEVQVKSCTESSGGSTEIVPSESVPSETEPNQTEPSQTEPNQT